MYDLIGYILQLFSALFISFVVIQKYRQEKRLKCRTVFGAIVGLILICYSIHDTVIDQEVKRYDFLWSADSVVLHSDSKEDEYDCTKIFADTHGVLLAPGHDHISASEQVQKVGTLIFRLNTKQVTVNVVRFVDPPGDLTRVNRIGDGYYAFLGDEFFTKTFKYDFRPPFASKIVPYLS
ncbi:MAG: hypothetical protein AB7E30_10700 [Lawsonibacter sp.]